MDSRWASDDDGGGGTDMPLNRQAETINNYSVVHLDVIRSATTCRASYNQYSPDIDKPGISSMRVLLREILVELDELAHILLHTRAQARQPVVVLSFFLSEPRPRDDADAGRVE